MAGRRLSGLQSCPGCSGEKSTNVHARIWTLAVQLVANQVTDCTSDFLLLWYVSCKCNSSLYIRQDSHSLFRTQNITCNNYCKNIWIIQVNTKFLKSQTAFEKCNQNNNSHVYKLYTPCIFGVIFSLGHFCDLCRFCIVSHDISQVLHE